MAKAKKLDLYKFTSKDASRVAMSGVFHEEGARIATDGHILVWEKAEYPQQYEGKIVSKDARIFVNLAFPKYKKIYPNESEYKELKFNKKNLEEAIKLSKEYKKTTGAKLGKASKVWVQDPDDKTFTAVFSFEMAELTLEYLKCHPDAVCYVKADHKRDTDYCTHQLYWNSRAQYMFMFKDESSYLLVMPLAKVYGNSYPAELEELIVTEDELVDKLSDQGFYYFLNSGRYEIVGDPHTPAGFNKDFGAFLVHGKQMTIYNKQNSGIELTEAEQNTLELYKKWFEVMTRCVDRISKLMEE